MIEVKRAVALFFVVFLLSLLWFKYQKDQWHHVQVELSEKDEQIETLKKSNDMLKKSKEDLLLYKEQAEWKIEESHKAETRLQNELKETKNNLFEAKIDKNITTEILKHKIEDLRSKLDNDPRNGCQCLCNSSDNNWFCLSWLNEKAVGSISFIFNLVKQAIGLYHNTIPLIGYNN